MFGCNGFLTRNLIVVYKNKDEISLNQLRKLVDSNDDDKEKEMIIGTEDGTVHIVPWDEKTYLSNKQAGNLAVNTDKYLFLGDIKGVDKLKPTLDIKYDKYGVSYGFSGRQAAICIDPKPLLNKEEYDSFVTELKRICDASTVNDKRSLVWGDKNENIKMGMWYVICTALFGTYGIIAKMAYDAFGDAKIIRNQQLLYGVACLYLNDLDDFMKR